MQAFLLVFPASAIHSPRAQAWLPSRRAPTPPFPIFPSLLRDPHSVLGPILLWLGLHITKPLSKEVTTRRDQHQSPLIKRWMALRWRCESCLRPIVSYISAALRWASTLAGSH